MSHNAHHQHGAEQVRCIIGNDHHPPQQHNEHENNGNRYEQSQLIADNGEAHVVLCQCDPPRLQRRYLRVLLPSQVKPMKS